MAYDTVLEALGDRTRRRIFELLGPGPKAVGEIAGKLPVTRPAVSQHLKVLREAGLVTDRAEGTRRVYAIRAEGVAETRAYFDRMWTEALDAFKEAADTGGDTPRGKGGRRGRNDRTHQKKRDRRSRSR
jgi:DNA-binding transcriptional ArsR family regulator